MITRNPAGIRTQEVSNEASTHRSPSTEPTHQPPLQQPSQPLSQPHIEGDEPYQSYTSSASTAPNTSDSTRKKGRGPALGYQGKEKIKVIFNDLGQPIGDSSTDLMNVFGGIARCGAHAPLNVVLWRVMPEANLELIWREILHKTNATEEHKRACMKKVGELWKKWKHRVKDEYYIPNKDNAEKLLIPPTDTRVSPDQWPFLVDYWQRQEVEKEALHNSSNRKQLEFPHRTGRTSHANIRAEMSTNNEDTPRANVFIKTRSKKDGTIPHDDTRFLVERMKEKLDKVPVEDQTPAYKEKVFVDLMGPNGNGRVRTFGSGPSHRDVFGSRPSSTTPSSDEIENLVDAKVAQKVSQFQMEMLEKMERMQHLLEAHRIVSSTPRPDTNGSGSSARINSPMDDLS